ncbi:MAG: hypothetical protein MZV70_69000 [Desulfobacterales bacterium]|nr:hypothetical protein [Desulfobacterales bacterium]
MTRTAPCTSVRKTAAPVCRYRSRTSSPDGAPRADDDRPGPDGTQERLRVRIRRNRGAGQAGPRWPGSCNGQASVDSVGSPMSEGSRNAASPHLQLQNEGPLVDLAVAEVLTGGDRAFPGFRMRDAHAVRARSAPISEVRRRGVMPFCSHLLHQGRRPNRRGSRPRLSRLPSTSKLSRI